MTRTTPSRLMILHLSHIFFTDARTFIALKPPFVQLLRLPDDEWTVSSASYR